MQKCNYSVYTNCEVCDKVFYKQCDKFIKYHIASLTKAIQPFKYNKFKLTDPVVWSKDKNIAKSCALQYALKKNAKVNKYTLSQVMAMCLSNEIPDIAVCYIECTDKLQGDIEKITSVINSFIDRAQLDGAYVAIYVAPNVTLTLNNYTKL